MQDYDAIVIGSGAGGLTAALAIARSGQRVAVFEQHYLPGGYSQSFVLNGFRFSPGVHYVGALGPGGGLRHIYEGLGVANDLVFLELNPDGYDHAVIGAEHFAIPKGKERFAAKLKVRFPGEAAGIDRYFDIIGRMADELGYATPTHSLTDVAKLTVHMPTVLLHGLSPLSHFLDSCTADPLLRAILSIQSGDHGMAPSRAPTALHAGLQGYYFDGGCYPRGGGHAIPEAFVRHICRHGGQVKLRTEVSRILIEDGKVLGVRLADGREVRADVVVSNADPGVTWGKLVAPEHLGWQLRHRIEKLHYSVSTISLFMAVDMDLRAAGLDSGNIWYSRTPDIDAVYEFAERAELRGTETIPGLFFNATTLKDPSMRHDGLHTVEAMTLSSVDAFARWKDNAPGARAADYARLKEDLAERILDAIESFVPGLREHVVFRAVGTPLTNMHYLHATRGGIYGTEKTLGNLGPFSFSVETHIRGLYQCGASTIAPGINGVTNSGLDAAAAALGCRRDDLLHATGQALRVYPADHPESWPADLRDGRRRSVEHRKATPAGPVGENRAIE
jgi:phytoene dehydrogenase-like protein